MTTAKTPNLNLELVEFNESPWHDPLNRNFRGIDATIRSLFGLTSLLGEYQNSTAVTVGQRYFDVETGYYYEALSNFNTLPVPNTFEDERTAHPLRWKLIDAAQALTAAVDAEAAKDAAETARDVTEGYRDTVAADKAIVAADKATVAADKATVAADKATVAGDKATVSALIGPIAADIAALGAISAQIVTVAGIDTEIVAVASNSVNINLVAGKLTEIDGVYDELVEILAVYAKLTEIGGVYGALTAINAVYADIAKVNGVYAELAEISAVYGALADIQAAAADLPSLAAKANTTGSNINVASFLSALGLSGNDLVWRSKGIGEIVAIQDHITGANVPDATNANYVFIELTSGKTGSGQFNNGKLTSESVSGSSPTIVATATIAVSGSPMNGQTVRLLNTEGRFLRGGTTSGVVQDSDNLSHTHTASTGTESADHSHTPYANYVACNLSAGASFTVLLYTGGYGTTGFGYTGGRSASHTHAVTVNSQGGTEARPRNMSVKYFMRVK